MLSNRCPKPRIIYMYIKKVALSLACSKYVNSHRSEVGYMLEVEFDKE